MLESNFLIENWFFSLLWSTLRKHKVQPPPLQHHHVLEAVHAEEKIAAVYPTVPSVNDAIVHTFCSLMMHLGVLP